MRLNSGKYNWIHALAAAIVLIAAVSNNFWRNFLHGGFTSPPPAKALLTAVAMQTGLTALLLLALWASTLFYGRVREAHTPTDGNASLGTTDGGVGKGLKFALMAFVPICLAAFALEFLSIQTLEKIFHLPARGQDLVQWLKPGTYPLYVRLALVFVAIVQAPVMEELLFRGIVFRGLAKHLPAFAAMALSGVLFSVVHVNAAAFVPLWFLGIAFAWLYHRTGSILASMTAHFLFNLLNLVLVLSGMVE